MTYRLGISLLLLPAPALAQSVSGEATVIDGDTLVVGGERIRLFGIDAPELDQTCSLEGSSWACGEEAAAQLRSITVGQIVNCVGVERDQHARIVATCSAAGYDLGATMVEYGWAVAFRKYSTNYVAHEHRAKAAKAGIWRSDFILPHRRTGPEGYKTTNLNLQPKSPVALSKGTAAAAATGFIMCLVSNITSRPGLKRFFAAKRKLGRRVIAGQSAELKSPG
jgi:endonuclease YncB( thermonuclease family)